jgi:uracil-DNA glycosylase family 4
MLEPVNRKSATPLIAAGQMREIEAQVRACQLCKLAKTRTRAVPGEGSFQAEVMFIGEGPGYHEDKQGRPFVGPAGQFLNELLSIAGLSRETVYITNVVKCRPPNNRDPEPIEMAACALYLERQIALINPRIIVTLGRYSMAKFFPGEKISQIHGTARMVDGRLCVAMYHPAAGLHQASLADVIRTDFRLLPVYIEQAGKMLAPPPPPAAEEVVEPGVTIVPAAPGPETLAHREELSIVQEASTVYNASEEITPTAQPGPVETQEIAVPAGKAGAKSKKPATKKEEYKQISFLDM